MRSIIAHAIVSTGSGAALKRQVNDEFRAAARTVLDFDATAVRFDQPFDNGQTQARPARRRARDTVKFFKNMRTQDCPETADRDRGPPRKSPSRPARPMP